MNPPISSLSRRRFIQGSIAGAGVLAAAPLASQFAAAGEPAAKASVRAGTAMADATYPFELPVLPYPANALELAIDARTMEIHHGKHHAGYVTKLNAALEPHPELHGLALTDLLTRLDTQVPESIRTAVRNNGGGHWNHTLFWTTLSPTPSEPSGPLAEAIQSGYGSVEAMLDKVVAAGLGQFGSGWAWVVRKADGSLDIVSTPNQDNPLMTDSTVRPVLGVDVWEHAYYLRYQNRRGDYLAAWKSIINWQTVAALFA